VGTSPVTLLPIVGGGPERARKVSPAHSTNVWRRNLGHCNRQCTHCFLRCVRLTEDIVVITPQPLRVSLAAFERFVRRPLRSRRPSPTIRALPGAGAALAPRLLAAFGEQRERYQSAAELQSTPVSHPSLRTPCFSRITFERSGSVPGGASSIRSSVTGGGNPTSLPDYDGSGGFRGGRQCLVQGLGRCRYPSIRSPRRLIQGHEENELGARCAPAKPPLSSEAVLRCSAAARPFGEQRLQRLGKKEAPQACRQWIRPFRRFFKRCRATRPPS
jgi:hypothetical protein